MPGRKASETKRREQIFRAAFEVAARDGLEGLTVRKVSTRARLSSGLVLFHFRTKDKLIRALLDWVLATTTVLHVTDDIAQIVAPLDRLIALLRREMYRLPPIRHREVGLKMQVELARYREAFRPMAEEVLQSEPDRFEHVTADSLAAVAVSFIKGCAVQSMIDADQFDIEAYLAAVQGMVGHFGALAI